MLIVWCIPRGRCCCCCRCRCFNDVLTYFIWFFVDGDYDRCNKIKTQIHQLIFGNSTILFLFLLVGCSFFCISHKTKERRPQIDTANDSSRKANVEKQFMSTSMHCQGMRERKKKQKHTPYEQPTKNTIATTKRSIKTIWPHAVTHLLCLCMLYYLDRINDGTHKTNAI